MRTLHRWVSTCASLLLLWVSITGVLLALDTMWKPGGLEETAPEAAIVAEQRWFNDRDTRFALHQLLQDLHRGSIIGIPGQALGILTGFCFLFLCISGGKTYFEMLSRRRRAGEKSLFWGSELSMRSLHRWLGSALLLFLLYLTATGTATAIAQLMDPESTRPLGPPPGGPPSAMASQPGIPIQGGVPPSRPGQRDGDVPVAVLLQDFHSGDIAGRPGQWAMLITGVSLVILWISGAWIFCWQWSRRKARGQRSLFWK